MPSDFMPLCGPVVNRRSKVLGDFESFNSTVPPYSSPIAMVVKRSPSSTIFDPLKGVLRPSASNSVTVHVPCSFLRSPFEELARPTEPDSARPPRNFDLVGGGG